MKSKIHPKYQSDAKVECACGNTFTTGSTQEKINVEICSACHPFFTGEVKYIDTQGRVEKFRQKMEAAKKQDKTKKKEQKTQPDKDQQPKTLKDMLQEQVKESKE